MFPCVSDGLFTGTNMTQPPWPAAFHAHATAFKRLKTQTNRRRPPAGAGDVSARPRLVGAPHGCAAQQG
jgi:hypothetical protein